MEARGDHLPAAPAAEVHSSHSRTVHSSGDTPEALNAPARAGAREYDPSSAQSQVHSQDPPRKGLSDWLQPLMSGFTPPDIVRQDRPSLRKVWAYGARGAYTAESGSWRAAGRLYSFAASAAIGVLYYLAWLVERPSRLLAAAVLAFLIFFEEVTAWVTSLVT